MAVNTAFMDYAFLLQPEVKKQVIDALNKNAALSDIVLGKWQYYKGTGAYEATDAGLAKAAKDISADMINEGHGMSVSDITHILFSDNFFSVLWNRASSALSNAIPWYLKPGVLITVAVLFGGAYLLNTYGSFIPRARGSR